MFQAGSSCVAGCRPEKVQPGSFWKFQNLWLCPPISSLELLIYPSILHTLWHCLRHYMSPSSLYLRLIVTYPKPDVCKMSHLQKLEETGTEREEALAGGRDELKIV